MRGWRSVLLELVYTVRLLSTRGMDLRSLSSRRIESRGRLSTGMLDSDDGSLMRDTLGGTCAADMLDGTCAAVDGGRAPLGDGGAFRRGSLGSERGAGAFRGSLGSSRGSRARTALASRRRSLLDGSLRWNLSLIHI